MTKSIAAVTIKDRLGRIASEFRHTSVSSAAARERRETACLPAAMHVDEAIKHLRAFGTNPAQAAVECAAALALFGTHPELKGLLDDLEAVCAGSATLR